MTYSQGFRAKVASVNQSHSEQIKQILPLLHQKVIESEMIYGLAVDDSVVKYKACSHSLKKVATNVFISTNGVKALEQYIDLKNKHPMAPIVIVMDMNMVGTPGDGNNGDEAIIAIRALETERADGVNAFIFPNSSAEENKAHSGNDANQLMKMAGANLNTQFSPSTDLERKEYTDWQDNTLLKAKEVAMSRFVIVNWQMKRSKYAEKAAQAESNRTKAITEVAPQAGNVANKNNAIQRILSNFCPISVYPGAALAPTTQENSVTPATPAFH